MSVIDYRDVSLTDAQSEMIELGRRRYEDMLRKIGGRHATVVRGAEVQFDNQSGTRLDLFTLDTLQPLTALQLSILQRTALFHSLITLRPSAIIVRVDHARYDTRWFAINMTQQQRHSACFVLFIVAMLLLFAVYVEHCRRDYQRQNGLVANVPPSTMTVSHVEGIVSPTELWQAFTSVVARINWSRGEYNATSADDCEAAREMQPLTAAQLLSGLVNK